MNIQESHCANGRSRSGTTARPPILLGYTYDPAEAYRARDAGRLLAIRLETNRTCNLRCRYCDAESGVDPNAVRPYEVLVDRVQQAHGLGAESIVVIGGGEPTIHPQFRDLIDRIHDLGMVPMVFSNGLAIGDRLAVFLFDRGASVMTKLDSLRPDRQDFLAGMDGAYDRIRRGIEYLLEAGFGRPDDPGRLRLGASFVSCRMNQDEIADIWRFCRDGLYPYNTGLMTLREIYTSPLFRYVRHIDEHLEGKCGGCEHLDECIGCRGYAYAVGVNAGKPPHVALRGECLQCAKPVGGACSP